MSRIGSTIRSAKMKAITPPKLMPPFQRTAANGTFPIEQTKLMIATTGPMIGPQNVASVSWFSRKSDCHQASGTQAASAPAGGSIDPWWGERRAAELLDRIVSPDGHAHLKLPGEPAL